MVPLSSVMRRTGVVMGLDNLSRRQGKICYMNKVGSFLSHIWQHEIKYCLVVDDATGFFFETRTGLLALPQTRDLPIQSRRTRTYSPLFFMAVQPT
jgi:hypothetical protein